MPTFEDPDDVGPFTQEPWEPMGEVTVTSGKSGLASQRGGMETEL